MLRAATRQTGKFSNCCQSQTPLPILLVLHCICLNSSYVKQQTNEGDWALWLPEMRLWHPASPSETAPKPKMVSYSIPVPPGITSLSVGYEWSGLLFAPVGGWGLIPAIPDWLVSLACTPSEMGPELPNPSPSWGESHRMHFPKERSHVLWEPCKQPTNEKQHWAACSRICPAWPVHSQLKDKRM